MVEFFCLVGFVYMLTLGAHKNSEGMIYAAFSVLILAIYRFAYRIGGKN